MEKYLKSNMCHLPWTSIETRPYGEYRPCCVYNKDILDENGQPYTTKQHSIDTVMNSKAMKKLRQQFLANERPDACDTCWKVEDAGNTSKRQHMWQKSPLLGQMHIEKNIVAPRFIDLKLGNICNLKCRICSVYSSSQWVPDMIKLDPKKKEEWKNANKAGMWPRQKSIFLGEIEKWLPYVKFFEITGGEPLMIQEQFDILQKCIDLGVAKDIDVHYNTNGTQFPEHALEKIWPHFKRIELAVSIDDIDKRFEYQRTNAKWSEVNENILKFKDSGLHNLKIHICTTINFFNIMYIDELAKKVKEWDPEFWFINVLSTPTEFDVQRIDTKAKGEIVRKLTDCKIYKQEIKQAINYLSNDPTNPEYEIDKKRRWKIKAIDNVRKENFKEVFPDLNKLVKIYE